MRGGGGGGVCGGSAGCVLGPCAQHKGFWRQTQLGLLHPSLRGCQAAAPVLDGVHHALELTCLCQAGAKVLLAPWPPAWVLCGQWWLILPSRLGAGEGKGGWEGRAG